MNDWSQARCCSHWCLCLGGGAVGATSWYETILLWPLHHPLLHPLGSPSCYSPSTPHLTGSVSADKGWHLLWSCSLDYAASTKPSTEKGTISPSVLRVGYAVVINTDDDNISRWSAVEESWTLSPAFLMRCNVIADFRVMGLKILSEGKGDWNSSREIGGKKRTLSGKIKPWAVSAVGMSTVWFMDQMKWPCLRAVGSGSCDLPWYLDCSHHMHSACEDGEGRGWRSH